MNPIDGTATLHPGSADDLTKNTHQQTEILPGDSATTKAEKIERQDNGSDERAAKRIKLDDQLEPQSIEQPKDNRAKGVAPIKAEYLIPFESDRSRQQSHGHDDDAAEADGAMNNEDGNSRTKKQKNRGQNKARRFGSSKDEIALCSSRALYDEFSPVPCKFGEKCRFEHDLRKYMEHGRREDLQTFGGKCPSWEVRGHCGYGWKCRFIGSHSEEKTHEDGRKEFVLSTPVNNNTTMTGENGDEDEDISLPGVVNVVNIADKILLRKKKFQLPKSEAYIKWMDERQEQINKVYHEAKNGQDRADARATYREAPLLPSEKRRIYYGPETPILAPLTTQGNLPFRRLCVSLGAQVTWSEMAMGQPLLSGQKGEWALLKAHESELLPPRYSPKAILSDYDNSKDIKFGAQIAANKPWLATKTTEMLTKICPSLRAIDLNSGCPIDLVYRQGAGSALMDNPSRLEKILRGMNVVSDEVPITVKIRTGTKDNQPTAAKLVQRLVLGGNEAQEANEGPAGVAAITLHGRSRQQRYTKDANWEYIAETASVIRDLQIAKDDVTDTVREVDARQQTSSNNGQVYFIGNGDCFSHVDYYTHLRDAKVDSVMLARGALVKPWIFEEIEKGQYLDKSSTERLAYIEQFARNGLEYWGSDEMGVGQTRRFLLEWLSFSCRYVPLGLLETLPPRLGDRPPMYRGRDDLETLLCSPNYKDWIKIRYVISPISRFVRMIGLTVVYYSEMFLGPAHKDFNFQPKHKSNSYDNEAEG